MDIGEIQAYAYFASVVILTILLYWYIFSLYYNDKKGKTNYEKFSRMALDDELNSPVVDDFTEEEKKAKKKGAGQ